MYNPHTEPIQVSLFILKKKEKNLIIYTFIIYIYIEQFFRDKFIAENLQF